MNATECPILASSPLAWSAWPHLQYILHGSGLELILEHIDSEADLLPIRSVSHHWRNQVQRRLVVGPIADLIAAKRYLSAVHMLLWPKRRRRDGPYQVDPVAALGAARAILHAPLARFILTRYPYLRSCIVVGEVTAVVPVVDSASARYAAMLAKLRLYQPSLDEAARVGSVELARCARRCDDLTETLVDASRHRSLPLIHRILDGAAGRLISYRAATYLLTMPAVPASFIKKVVYALSPLAATELYYRYYQKAAAGCAVPHESIADIYKTYYHVIDACVDQQALQHMPAYDRVSAQVVERIGIGCSVVFSIPLEDIAAVDRCVRYHFGYRSVGEDRYEVTMIAPGLLEQVAHN